MDRDLPYCRLLLVWLGCVQGRRKYKRNIGIELAVNALEIAKYLDHIVLFSGDGDFLAFAPEHAVSVAPRSIWRA